MPMRRFSESEEVDYVIVGCGSAGGVLLQRLARSGFQVVAIEAGPFWDTERDWVSDESGSHSSTGKIPASRGDHPLALGANNCGRGVGGGSVHWAAFTPRLHPSDFEVYTRDGIGVDWPSRMRFYDPTTNSSKSRCPLLDRRTIPGDIRMVMPMARIQWAA